MEDLKQIMLEPRQSETPLHIGHGLTDDGKHVRFIITPDTLEAASSWFSRHLARSWKYWENVIFEFQGDFKGRFDAAFAQKAHKCILNGFHYTGNDFLLKAASVELAWNTRFEDSTNIVIHIDHYLKGDQLRFRRCQVSMLKIGNIEVNTLDFEHVVVSEVEINSGKIGDLELNRSFFACGSFENVEIENRRFVRSSFGATAISGTQLYKDVVNPAEYLKKHFKYDANKKGYYVWKLISADNKSGGVFSFPEDWVIAEGSIIREKGLNRDHETSCTSGIYFGTRKYLLTHHNYSTNIWLCFIPESNLHNVIVPGDIHSNKARTNELHIVRMLTEEETEELLSE